MIEMIQYCPEYKTKQENQLNEMITVLNLRGNAHRYPQQLQFLKEFSDLIVVVANELNDFKLKILRLADKDEWNFLWVGNHNNAANMDIGRVVVNRRFQKLDDQNNEFQVMVIKTHIASFINGNSG